jgi:hypothetical protein
MRQSIMHGRSGFMRAGFDVLSRQMDKKPTDTV